MVASSSLVPLRLTMSTAAMIMPGVQKPHCRPWCSRKAACIGCSSSPWPRPSMVVTVAPSQESASVVQALHGPAVDMHDAGAALAGVAADVRAGQAQVLAQELHEQRARLDVGCDRFAVDGHRYGFLAQGLLRGLLAGRFFGFVFGQSGRGQSSSRRAPMPVIVAGMAACTTQGPRVRSDRRQHEVGGGMLRGTQVGGRKVDSLTLVLLAPSCWLSSCGCRLLALVSAAVVCLT